MSLTGPRKDAPQRAVRKAEDGAIIVSKSVAYEILISFQRNFDVLPVIDQSEGTSYGSAAFLKYRSKLFLRNLIQPPELAQLSMP